MMRPPNRAFRNHGSADQLDIQITGYEWLRLFKFMKNKTVFFLTILFDCINSVSPYVMALIQGQLATVLISGTAITGIEFINDINEISLLLFISIVIVLAAFVAHNFLNAKFVPDFQLDVNHETVRSIFSQEIGFFDEKQTGVILSRLTDDIATACSAYTERVTFILRCIVQWITGLIVSFTESWKTTLMMLGILPIYALSNFLGNKFVDKLWLSYNDRSTQVTAKAEEILNSIRTIKSFDAEFREYKIYKQKLMDVHEVMCKTSYVHGIKDFVNTISHFGMISLILLLTGKQAVNKEIEPGAIVVEMTIANNWNFAFAQIFSLLIEFKKSNVSSAKLLEIIEREPKIKLDEGRNIEKVSGRIEFKDVVFKYPSRNENALDGASFVVEPGETVALVGESGCGKSTTLQLIQRFYNVASGEILLDGVNINEVTPTSLRNFVAIVPQTPVMFSMSVKDNIRFGKPSAKTKEVKSAAEVANADEFIKQLANGYKTEVQQNSLSGGQKQRICIARSVMMSAPVLLLDEATAALDTESEKLVQEAIGKYKDGRTVIIVAHRLATVRNAKRILVMEKGKIIESGTHEELLQRNGAYAQLIQSQLQ